MKGNVGQIVYLKGQKMSKQSELDEMNAENNIIANSNICLCLLTSSYIMMVCMTQYDIN